MLRPWSKPLTLALSANSAVVRHVDDSITTLAELDAGATGYTSLLQAIAEQSDVLAQHRVRIILSNHFVRYGVLPWQPGVSKRADWEALASHDFRQRYGAVADNWTVHVSLRKFGYAVLTLAVDQALLQGLQDIAHCSHWHVASIEPLLKPLLNNIVAVDIEDQAWLLMAEPGRVVLGEMQQGQYQRFSAISPPPGREQDSADELIARTLLQYDAEQQPRQIFAAISSQIAQGWKNTLIKPIPAGHGQPHAAWLAKL